MKQHDIPSKTLFLNVRAGFVQQNTTFSEWCRKEDINRSNARQALIGSWDGPKAKALRARIIKASQQGCAA
jgi:hypothetical protein